MSDTTTLYILYGSATGNAEHIAKDLASQPPPAPFTATVCEPLEKYRRYQEIWTQPPASPSLSKHAMIVITSTTGNGDTPENASRFVRYIKRKTTPNHVFQHCAFAVLGLGDTNYDQFCQAAKNIDKRMGELQGQRIQTLTCADEATGLEDTVEPWVNGIFEQMVKACVVGDGGVEAGEEKQMDPADAFAPPQQEAPKVAAPVPPPPVKFDLPETSSSPLFILYASETGNAEAIAKDLAATYNALLKNPDSKLKYFQEVVCIEADLFRRRGLEIWQTEPPAGTKHGILVVSSTTGVGDTPENGGRFARYLKRKTTPVSTFQHCAYAVLALGDTNYDLFCGSGKLMDKRMEELGGTRIKPIACADDATGLEEVVEPWTRTILIDITNACRGGVPADASAAKMKGAGREEEKKEVDVVPPSKSPGVQLLRSLLGCEKKALPVVDKKSVPSLGACLSTCRLVSKSDESLSKSKEVPTAEIGNVTIGSDSSDVKYTFGNPFQSTVAGARYLTNTSTDAAKKVAEMLTDTSNQKLLEAMKIYGDTFPLQGNDTNGKRVIELTLSLPDDLSFEFLPGDSIGLIVPNPPGEVQSVLKMLKEKHGIDGSQLISINSAEPVTVEHALRHCVDLSSPIKKKRVLRELLEHAKDPEEADALRLLSSRCKDGKEAFHLFVDKQRMTVVDLLAEFPSSQCIPLDRLIGMLPGIPSRYYSVSSSPLQNSRSLTIAFSVVDYLTPETFVRDRKRKGGVVTRYLEVLSSGFLCGGSSCCEGLRIPIFPKPAADFHLPQSLSTPLVLIGPGTGIAPFIGFLQHRQAQVEENSTLARGVIDVFFGCRHKGHDYLYASDLEDYAKSGLIRNLKTAFSRDGNKQYVQDLMDDAMLDLILNSGAHVYICGDGNAMAKDVQGKIIALLTTKLGSQEKAQGYLNGMKSECRFFLDIWS